MRESQRVPEDTGATLGHELARLLASRGVDTVFGIPGAHNLELYRGLGAEPRLRHVLVRHEQSAGYAADAHWRVTGRPAGVFVTSGPAVANVLVAAGTAYADRVPMLVVSPGPEPDRSWRQDGWLHLTKDQHGMADAVFGRSVRAETPEGALWALNSFLLEWSTGRSRLPAHLEVPASLFAAVVDPGIVDALPWAESGTQAGGVLAADAFEHLLARMRERSETPSIAVVVGRGAADAGERIAAFAERAGALVVETGDAKGVVRPAPAGSLGAAAEFPQAMAAVFACDVVLVVGSELRSAEAALPADRDALVVRVGGDWLERNSNLVPDLAYDVDAADLFERLGAALPGGAAPGPRGDAPDPAATAARVRAEIAAEAPEYVRRAVALIAELAEHDPVLVGDSSQVCYFGVAPLLDGPSAGRYLNSFGYSTLGYAVPGGIGAALGGGSSVLCVTGDGALLFSVAELMTAAAHRLPIAVLVVDNGGYGEIRDEMVAAGIDPLGVDFAIPDLGAIAAGFGARFVDLRDPDGFSAAVEAAWAADGPTVIRLGADVLEAS